MSLHIVNHDHVTYKVFYGPGRYVIPASKSSVSSTPTCVSRSIRNPADVQKVNALQDQLQIEYPAGYTPKHFKATA
ncbi:hypothetical protein ACTSKR_01365 [Chitinibacteraceae bacterium HSL-7]